MVKNLPANAGDLGLIPELGRCPGEGSGNSSQYSCLKNPMNRGSVQATVPEVVRVFAIKQQKFKESLQAINAGEGVEKREPSYTIGGNAN